MKKRKLKKLKKFLTLNENSSKIKVQKRKGKVTKVTEVECVTKREMLELVVNGVVNDEVKEQARAELAKMDARNAKKKTSEKVLAKRRANKEMYEKLVSEVLTTEYKTAQELADALGVKPQTVQAVMRQNLDDRVNVTDVVNDKRRVVKGYALASLS